MLHTLLSLQVDRRKGIAMFFLKANTAAPELSRIRSAILAAVRSFHASLLLALLSAGALGAVSIQLSAQTKSADSPSAEQAATLTKATAARDAFVARIHADGYSCPIPVPTILVEDVPSFGQYDEKTNIIRTSDWTLLNPEERAFFFRLSGPGAKEADVHRTFEQGAHGWIFIHELGHWWQACRSVAADRGPYQVEYGADCISLAYWREVDPAIVDTMMPIFKNVLANALNPVPAGEDVEAYFNKHYQELGPSPAYPWFQSRMNVTAYDEKPAPTFAQALLNPFGN
jgi:hypothetical protein